MNDFVILVEVDLYDSESSSIETLRISNQRYVGYVGGERVLFESRLLPPILIGSSISADEYTQVLRGVPNGGNIDFLIDETFYKWFNYHWLGRTFRIYKGDETKAFGDFELIYEGRVADLNFDLGQSQKVSIKTTDAGEDFNKPLVSDLYGSTALEANIGKPKAFLRGEVYSAEPILEDNVNQIYSVSHGANLSQVIEVRVGGVPWKKVTNTPKGGEWFTNLAGGTITLGSVTLNGEVRVDVRALGYESLTAADLIKEVVEAHGHSVDLDSYDKFKLDAPAPIGVYFIEAINIQDFFDVVTFAVGGWWEFGPSGKIRMGVIAEPSASGSVMLLDKENILNLSLNKMILPGYRFRVEYKHHWQPVSNVFSGVTDAEKALQQANGIMADVFEDNNIKILEPQAIDVPILSTITNSNTAALSIRNRLVSARSVLRKLYDVTYYGDLPEMYDSIEVDYLLVKGFFRVHSVVRSIGNKLGPHQLQIWG